MKFDISPNFSFIVITFPGVLMANMGIAVRSYIVLKMFHSWERVPLRTMFRMSDVKN